MAEDSGAVEKWEAWSNREYVIFQHLEPMYKADKALAKVITHRALGHHRVKELPDWSEFLTWFGESILKAKNKVKKLNGSARTITDEITDIYERFIGNDRNRITVEQYASALLAMASLYDELGYSLAEKKQHYSQHVSSRLRAKDRVFDEKMEMGE